MITNDHPLFLFPNYASCLQKIGLLRKDLGAVDHSAQWATDARL